MGIATFKGKKIVIPDEYHRYVQQYETAAEAALRAAEVVEQERQDEQLGLYCRWGNMNRSMSKYWRFNHVTALAGMPGSGKSYILNMLLNDFTDLKTREGATIPALNCNFKYPVICLHAGYEMDAADEVLRSVSGMMKTSYSYLISSQWDGSKYNKISNKEMDEIKYNLDGVGKKPIYYIRSAGTAAQLYCTAYEIQNKFPEAKLIISNDHTLLNLPAKTDKSENDLIATSAKWFIKMRQDFGSMIIALCQLNGNIMTPERKTNPTLHFPMYTDIHGSNQMYMATDNTVIFHRPILLNLQRYGEKDTTGKVINQLDRLIHGAMVKSRKGSAGNIWFKEDFAHGNMLEAVREDFMTDEDVDFNA